MVAALPDGSVQPCHESMCRRTRRDVSSAQLRGTLQRRASRKLMDSAQDVRSCRRHAAVRCCMVAVWYSSLCVVAVCDARCSVEAVPEATG